MKMFINEFKNIDESIVKIRTIGVKVSFIIGLFFTYILFLYSKNPVSQFAFDIGYSGVKLCLMFLVSFYVCSFAFNIIRNGNIN